MSESNEHKLSDLLARKRLLDDMERVHYRRYRTSAEWWADVERNLPRIEDILTRDWRKPEAVLFHKELRRIVPVGEVYEWDAGSESHIGEMPPRKNGEADLEICRDLRRFDGVRYHERPDVWRANLVTMAQVLEELKEEWLAIKGKRGAVAAQLKRVREIFREVPPITGVYPPLYEWRTRAGMFVGYIRKDV